MRCNLRCKFLLLFLAVMVVALSAAVMLRGFIINDFKSYLDGESQDRIQRLIAQLEGSYDTFGTWKREALTVDLAWALQMGVEARVYDNSDTRMLDTREAIELLTPLMRKRVLEVNGYEPESNTGEFTPYTLFLKGNEIGRLEARLLKPVKEEYFINSTNHFLATSLALLGILALVISLTASRRLAKPILELSDAAGDIAGGDLTRRVTIPGQDEIGKLSANFNRMAESLEAQEKLRGRLLSGAAHELRTPLAIISGELEGMIDGVLPTTREELQSMHNEATRLTSILNGLDELTRAESSVLNLRRELIELKPFLSAITGRFDRIFSEKNAVILLDCPDNLTFFADPDRLSQIIINLISNALKAVEVCGQVSIVATLENKNLRLEVTDNGTGISEENLPHVFERFYKGAGGGLGLGLAIVKELVTAHGGTVEAENDAQGGAKFILMFPADR